MNIPFAIFETLISTLKLGKRGQTRFTMTKGNRYLRPMYSIENLSIANEEVLCRDTLWSFTTQQYTNCLGL